MRLVGGTFVGGTLRMRHFLPSRELPLILSLFFFWSLYHLSLSAPGREPDGPMASAARWWENEFSLHCVIIYPIYKRGKVGTKQGLTSLGLYRHLLGLVILFVQSIPCSMTTWNALNKQYFFLLLQNTIIGLNFCSVLTQCIWKDSQRHPRGNKASKSILKRMEWTVFISCHTGDKISEILGVRFWRILQQ